MKNKYLFMSLFISLPLYAESKEMDFEVAVEEFTEATIETKPIDFADPTAAYSSVQLGYTSEGLDAGFGYARSLNDNWAGLIFAQSLDSFDAYRFRAAALSTNFGSGIMADYLYDDKNDVHTVVLNALQVLPLHERLLIAPVLGAGIITGEGLNDYVPIAMAQVYSVFKFNDELSMMIAPIYTTSLSDKNLKINTLDWEGNLSYRLTDSQNISISYGIYEQANNKVGLNYTYAF
ncbi:hypothetical protein AB4343_18465 [Vibrio breoganii]|uniref:Outer membrane protein beta-barrel domain-containing protein n=3 Tax=Vibrio breoganii TaxID=553239 RepID=A0ABX1U2K5_9VIBR|nr:hypothetical protein [Vibrio breoganii]NMO74772.1 hypothetical protein [Vibrio breoganii]NMR68699.1 hypothetical protein [Vibrio breoganii]PMG05613.1 hypothetical protein BCV02_18720 [Vibrio breoganii]PMG11648.1 hypothetical protein BCV00_17980 [Vibrio breoganii]PMI21749.1 hypothetical protein BCU49_18505 [Vibrio breoganii]